MRSITTLALFIAALSVTAAAQFKSTYTSTRTSACRTIESTSEEGGSYVGECRGVGGYKIRLIEGDIRQTLNVIPPGRKPQELNFWTFYSSFSHVGEKLEWRTKGAVPVALIARYNVANPDGTTKGVSYLMVSKIGRTSSCVTDVVEPGPDQNVKARQLADVAQSKPCRKSGE